jgi:tRNA A-37 threonylcarbamoyl transferase component Bud32
MEKPLVIDYSDKFSTAALWWKAFFLAPPWGFPLLIALGFVSSVLPILQALAYPIVLIFFLLYFTNEMLGRKIRIEAGVFHFGLFKFELSSLRSIGTFYKDNQILPTEMVLTFKRLDQVVLKLDNLNFEQYKDFLRLVENKYPHCQIDPVLSTLVRCKNVARKILVEDQDKIVIQYDGQRKIKQFLETFYNTAGIWASVGPILMIILACPMWVLATSRAFLLGRDIESMTSGWLWLSAAVSSIGMLDQKILQSVGAAISGLATATTNLSFAATMMALTGGIVGYLLHLSIRPIAIELDKIGLSVIYPPFVSNFIGEKAHCVMWSEVRRVRLVKNETASGTQLLIRFEKQNGKNYDIDFSAVATQDRPRLMKALDRLAPNCTVDSDLVEAMMPKQEHSYTELWLQSLSGNPERKSTQPLSPGAQLQNGLYLVEKRLGVGGQGTAYLCKNIGSGLRVVLKETIVPVFADHVVKEQVLKRFESEANMLRKLESDLVVKMEDHFFEDHRGYIVLEHIDGDNLRQVIGKKGAMAENEVLALANTMCNILAVLHEQSIIHRDFTPDNLILSNSGQLKLIDFNVAQIEQVGATGTIAGKHAYLPPEQFRGKATLQSDIYALGATLHFLLTGKDPEAISCSSPKEVNEAVSEQLDDLVKSCTDLRLSHRLQSVQAVKERLQKILAGTTPAIGYESENLAEEANIISIRTKQLDKQEA